METKSMTLSEAQRQLPPAEFEALLKALDLSEVDANFIIDIENGVQQSDVIEIPQE